MIRALASGYYDPVHSGHLEYLQMAKDLAGKDGKLIVIVNNDRQAILKKGFVVMPCEERMKIIQALRCVDEVIESIDEDSTVCKTLAMIRPTLFCKGGDKALSLGNIPEKKICDELGIKIIDGLGPKLSSSRLIVKNLLENTEKIPDEYLNGK